MQTSSQSMYNKLILITFFLLALATWWLRQQIGEPLESYSITSTNAPDYWIEHIAARIMDEQGKLRRILGAEKLQHFPTTNKSELIKPKLDFLNSKTPPWKVRADTGWIEADGALLVLPGLVTIDQDSAPGILPVHLETKDLKIRPKEQYAETEQTVKINNGLSHLQAKGLQIWLKPPIRIKLLAAVRAHYEITK
jgi:lipopolysaccharide export system protein LptC